jgi:hypothetical protein
MNLATGSEQKQEIKLSTKRIVEQENTSVAVSNQSGARN